MSTANNYALVKTGGKQYKATPGKTILVEKLAAKVGDSVKLDCTMTRSENGDVNLSGGSVSAKVLAHQKDKKVIIFKKKRTTGYTKKQGHRQVRTKLLIESIGK